MMLMKLSSAVRVRVVMLGRVRCLVLLGPLCVTVSTVLVAVVLMLCVVSYDRVVVCAGTGIVKCR